MNRMTRARRALTLTVVLLLCFVIAAEAESWICPNCGAQSSGDFNFCPTCGEPKPQAARGWICGKCGYECEDSFNFCPNCAAPRPTGSAGVKRVRLCDLDPYTYTKYGLACWSDVSDVRGNDYEWTFTACTDVASNTYDIGGKYTTLSGIVGVCYNSRSKSYKGAVRIYGDGLMLFEAKGITSDIKSYPIEVDISGVTDLKVEICGGPSFTQYMNVMLAEVWLR